MLYLKQFIIGSSFPIVAPYFYGFHTLKRPGSSYFNYTFYAPLWFGVWNVISLILAEHYKLSTRVRFLTISFITYISIVIIATYNNVYNFTKKQWIQYYIGLLLLYLFIWNIVIYSIENCI